GRSGRIPALPYPPLSSNFLSVTFLNPRTQSSDEQAVSPITPVNSVTTHPVSTGSSKSSHGEKNLMGCSTIQEHSSNPEHGRCPNSRSERSSDCSPYLPHRTTRPPFITNPTRRTA